MAIEVRDLMLDGMAAAGSAYIALFLDKPKAAVRRRDGSGTGT